MVLKTKIKSMKKLNLFTLILMFAVFMSFQSCKDNNEKEPNPEYIADDSSFSGYMSWPLESQNQGPDPAVGEAHIGNDSTVTRWIYFKNGQDPVSGGYPVGTIIVKHSGNPDLTVNEYTAMVKRGNDFNPNGGDWEWFILNANGTIASDGSGGKLRGANLLDGNCVACHAFATADYVFSK